MDALDGAAMTVEGERPGRRVFPQGRQHSSGQGLPKTRGAGHMTAEDKCLGIWTNRGSSPGLFTSRRVGSKVQVVRYPDKQLRQTKWHSWQDQINLLTWCSWQG